MVSFSKVRAQLDTVLHLSESPHRTALAFAVGVFIAFSPTYGLHTVMVLFSTWAFRLNFIALMIGAFINNPWTLVPILGATMWTGFLILGIPDTPTVQWQDLSPSSLYGHIMPYFLPFVVGAVVLSLVGAVLGYIAAYAFITRYRARLNKDDRASTRLPGASS